MPDYIDFCLTCHDGTFPLWITQSAYPPTAITDCELTGGDGDYHGGNYGSAESGRGFLRSRTVGDPGYDVTYTGADWQNLDTNQASEANSYTFFAVLTVNARSKRAVGHLHKGVELLNSGSISEAGHELEKAAALKPGLWEACYHLGGIYLKENRLEEAGEQFSKVLKAKPDLAEAYNALGMVYYKQGMVDIATAYLQASLRINPLDEYVNSLIETINGRGIKHPWK